MKLDLSREFRLGVLIAAVCFASVLLLLVMGQLHGLDNWLYRSCFRLIGERPTPQEIVIVGIDPDSIAALGPSPWSLATHAKLLQRLDQAGARVVVFDTDYLSEISQSSNSPQQYDLFASAIKNAACATVLPAMIESGNDPNAATRFQSIARHAIGKGEIPRSVNLQPGRLLVPNPSLSAVADGIGGINVYPERDGVLRAMPVMFSYLNTLFPAMPLEAYRQWVGADLNQIRRDGNRLFVADEQFPLLSSGEMLINFFGGYQHFPIISAHEVFDENAQRLENYFKHRLVIVGPVIGATSKFFRTPAGDSISGVELNANAIASLLQKSMLRQVPAWAVVILMLILAALLAATVGRAGVFRGAMITVTVLAICFGLVFSLFAGNIWFPLGAPMLCTTLIGVALVVRSAAISDRLRVESDIRLQSRMQAITGVGRLISSTLAQEELLNEIMHWVEAELDVEAASLLLLDEDTQRLRFVVALGEKGDEVKDFTLELGEGIVGTVAQTGQPIIVNNVKNDPRRHKDIPQAIDYPLHSVLCVPMTFHGEVIGVIEVMNKQDNMPFTQYDSSLLTVIAQQSCMFLENARLYGILQNRVDYANAELRKANETLAAEKSRVETMVQGMIDGVIAADETDRIVLINEAAGRMLTIESPESVVDKPVLSVLKHRDIVRLWATPLATHDGILSEEVQFDGDRLQVLQVTVARVGTGAEMLGRLMLLTDVTEFKQIDQLKSDLIAFISHELKTPITNIDLYRQLLSSKLTGAEEIEMLDVIRRQIIRMTHMVEDFLNLSRIDADRKLPMNLEPYAGLRDMIDATFEVEGHGHSEHRFECDIIEPPPILWADRTKLEEILANLVGNAIKYSPDGGLVRVSTAIEGEMAHIAVKDKGIGISPTDQGQLFQRFQRVGAEQSRIRGTGVGLFISKRLVEAHGGQIWVESAEGEGSTFHFTIPICNGQDMEDSRDQNSPT